MMSDLHNYYEKTVSSCSATTSMRRPSLVGYLHFLCHTSRTIGYWQVPLAGCKRSLPTGAAQLAPQRCPRPLSTAGPLGMTPDGGGDAGSSSVPLSTKDAAVGESVIRLMTRLSMQHGAVNLSQGFPNESPPLEVRVALARAVLTGLAELPPSPSDTEGGDKGGGGCSDHTSSPSSLVRGMVQGLQLGDAGGADFDELNQYSPPMGRPDLRQAISDHYRDMYGYEVDSDRCVTVTLGATEAVASALRTIGRPGDRAVIFEPYHELYPNQCRIFYLEPTYVTLREGAGPDGTWGFNVGELEDALKGAKVLLLNTPHNPTGKVFTREELRIITDLCIRHDVTIITDEIYEHMTYGSKSGGHIVIPEAFPKVADRTFVCNSVGKSASATGWRLGWCLTPPVLSEAYRGVHDQLVVMAPHPMQYAALTYLNLPQSYFRETLATRYVDRLQKLARSLRRVGFEVSDPEGAYYLFAQYRGVPRLGERAPWDAAMYMVKEVGVACVPGTNFYGSPQAMSNEACTYLRFAACRSVEDIDMACRKIEEFFA